MAIKSKTSLPFAASYESETDAKEVKELLTKEHKTPVYCLLASTDGDGVYVFYIKKPEEPDLKRLVARYFGITEEGVILDKDLIEI